MIDKQLILIEDDAFIAKSLLFVLKANCAITPVHFFTAEDAINSLLFKKNCIVLMDIQLPGMNGIDATKRIKRLNQDVDIIMISSSEDADGVFESLKAGAVGYITKTDIHVNIVPAILECIDGGAPMSTKIARMVATSFKQSKNNILSERETEVIKHLSLGLTYTQIATLLFIAPCTVRTHIKNIYVKLFAHNKSGAIKAARDQKII